MKLKSDINTQLLSSDSLASYFKPRHNPYKDTIFENYYLLNNKTKGTVGEKFAQEASALLNRKTKKRTSPGHDIIIDDIKTEVKVSLATNGVSDKFTFNHMATSKDYDRILLVGLNPEHTYMVWITKEDFIDFVIGEKYFTHQQGGKKSDNDDYMYITRDSWQDFLNEPCVHDFATSW